MTSAQWSKLNWFVVTAWNEYTVYDDLHTDLNTRYSFSEDSTGLGGLERSHLCLCVSYRVYGPWLMYCIYACVVCLPTETLMPKYIRGGCGLTYAFHNYIHSILAIAPIYINRYIAGMYVALILVFEYIHMKHTWR